MPQYGDELNAHGAPTGLEIPIRAAYDGAQGDYRSRTQRWIAQMQRFPTMRPLVDLMRRVFPGNSNNTAIFSLGGFVSAGTPWDFYRGYAAVYGNPTGYRCITAIANNFSRPNWMVLPEGTEWPGVGAEARALPGHPLKKLLDRPSPGMNGTSMQRMIGHDLELAGKSFWFKDRTGQGIRPNTPTAGTVQYLRRIPVQKVTVYGNTDDELLGMVYTDRAGRMAPMLPEQVLFFRYPNPERVFDGLAPSMVSSLPAETDTAGAKFNLNILQSDGAMPGYVILEGITRKQFAEWKEDWESTTVGRTRFIRGSNARYVKTAQTNQELTYHELRQDSQDDTLRAFGVPRAVAFDVSHETYANAEREQTIFMQHNILPKWVMTCDEATIQIGEEMGTPCRVAVNLVEIPELQDSRDAIVDRGVKLLQNQAQTVNEFRRLMGWAPVPWGDEPVAPSQPMSAVPLQPIGELPEGPPPPGGPAPRPAPLRLPPAGGARSRLTRVNGNGQ